ncbi:hypothetical protein ACFPM0_25830 [Pseudonocardia sulfidoxydans]
MPVPESCRGSDHHAWSRRASVRSLGARSPDSVFPGLTGHSP